LIVLTGPPRFVSGPSEKEKCFRRTSNKEPTKKPYVILERLSVTQWLGLGLKGIIWKVYRYDTIDKVKNICNIFGSRKFVTAPPPLSSALTLANRCIRLIQIWRRYQRTSLWWACWINKLIYCLIYFHSFLLRCHYLLLKGDAISLNTPLTNQTDRLKLKLRTPTLTVYRNVLVSSRAYLPKNRHCNHIGSQPIENISRVYNRTLPESSQILTNSIIKFCSNINFWKLRMMIISLLILRSTPDCSFVICKKVRNI